MSERTWCKIGHAYCDDDCRHCLPWLVVCEDCDEHGHTDSGDWVGDFDGHNPPLVYCGDCAEKRGLTFINSNGVRVYTQATDLEALIAKEDVG